MAAGFEANGSRQVSDDRITGTWHWVAVTLEITSIVEGEESIASVTLSTADARRLGEWLLSAARPRDPDGAF